MKKRNVFVVLTAVLAVTICSAAGGFGTVSVSAGATRKTLVNDDFTGDKIDVEKWLYYDSGIDLAYDKNVVKVKNGSNGTGITTKTPTGGAGARVEIDIKELFLGETSGNTGWMGIIFGASGITGDGQSAFSSTIDKVIEQKAGLHTLTMQNGKIKYQTPYVTDRKLVDGEGNVVENKDGYAFDVSDIFRDGKVAEGSLKIDYLYNGDFSLSVKSLSAADYKTVLKTSSQKLPAIAGGQVGVYFMESTDTSKHVLDAELYEVKVGSVTENGCKEIARFGEEDVLKDYYYSVSPASELKFGHDGRVLFSEENEEGYNLTARRKATATKDINKNCLSAEVNVDIKKITNGGQFGLCYGLEKLNSEILSAGSTYIGFTKSSEAWKMTVKYADENAVVTKGEALLPTGKFTLQTEVSADGTAEIFIDGEMILRAEGTNAEGYICLGQKSVAAGAVEAEIDNVVILNNYYDRPQNSEIIADFNDDDYNVNDWYIKSTGFGGISSGLYVSEGQLHFNNVAQDTTFATRRKYSNFELRFDITDLRRRVVYDEKGNKTYPVSSWIGVSFGCDREYVEDIVNFGEFYGTAPLLYFYVDLDAETWEKTSKTKLMLNNYGAYQSFELPDKFDFYDAANADKIVKIKMTMEDGVLTVKMKYDDGFYETVLMKDFGFTPLGFVQFWGMGDLGYDSTGGDALMVGKFTLDNISVSNLDKKPNIVDSKYESSKRPEREDYPYEEKDDDEEFLISPYIKGSEKVLGGVSGILAALSAVVKRRV